MRLKPHAAAWSNLGFFYERQQETAKAIDTSRKAVDLDPMTDRAWYGLGLALNSSYSPCGWSRELAAAGAVSRRLESRPVDLGDTMHPLHTIDNSATMAK